MNALGALFRLFGANKKRTICFFRFFCLLFPLSFVQKRVKEGVWMDGLGCYVLVIHTLPSNANVTRRPFVVEPLLGSGRCTPNFLLVI